MSARQAGFQSSSSKRRRGQQVRATSRVQLGSLRRLAEPFLAACTPLDLRQKVPGTPRRRPPGWVQPGQVDTSAKLLSANVGGGRSWRPHQYGRCLSTRWSTEPPEADPRAWWHCGDDAAIRSCRLWSAQGHDTAKAAQLGALPLRRRTPSFSYRMTAPGCGRTSSSGRRAPSITGRWPGPATDSSSTVA